MFKKLLAPVGFALLLCAACTKENDINSSPETSSAQAEQYNNGSRLLSAPATFTQKMIFEMFGTVHCATCPDMEQKVRAQIIRNPGRVFGYVAHNSDAMDIGYYDYLDSVFTVTTYASGMLNRTNLSGSIVVPKSRFNATNVNTCLAKVANCGLQITSTVSGNTATVTVDVGFNAAMSGSYKLTTVLCEDSVIGVGSNYNQSNYYNTIAGSLWFGLGNPIIGYQHDYVSRKVLSSAKIGDPIATSYIKPGGFFTKTYSVNVTGYNKNKLYIIAFVNKVGTTKMDQPIMNVQQAKLGISKNFD